MQMAPLPHPLLFVSGWGGPPLWRWRAQLAARAKAGSQVEVALQLRPCERTAADAAGWSQKETHVRGCATTITVKFAFRTVRVRWRCL